MLFLTLLIFHKLEETIALNKCILTYFKRFKVEVPVIMSFKIAHNGDGVLQLSELLPLSSSDLGNCTGFLKVP